MDAIIYRERKKGSNENRQLKSGKTKDGISKMSWVAPKRLIDDFECFDETGSESFLLSGIVQSVGVLLQIMGQHDLELWRAVRHAHFLCSLRSRCFFSRW